jgi:DNA oxidative demethylase
MGLPEGFFYQPEFVSEGEQRNLIDQFEQLEFSSVVMHGVEARRRVIHYGRVYAFESYQLAPGPPIPDFLLSIRTRSAELLATDPDELAEALITQYPPGAVIGWHRDAPKFGRVVGISLLSACRLRFRLGKGIERAHIELEPRSAYVLRGAARATWQHSIPAVKALRYSITFRTIRRP